MEMEAAQHSIHLQSHAHIGQAYVPSDLHTARPACLLYDLGGLFALLSKDEESDYFRQRWALAVNALSRL
jgi:hypothetical protein